MIEFNKPTYAELEELYKEVQSEKYILEDEVEDLKAQGTAKWIVSLDPPEGIDEFYQFCEMEPPYDFPMSMIEDRIEDHIKDCPCRDVVIKLRFVGAFDVYYSRNTIDMNKEIKQLKKRIKELEDHIEDRDDW